MATILDCPTCTRKLTVPDELVGQPVRCPDCGGTFETAPDGGPVPGSGPPAASPVLPAAAAEKPCPFCGESIAASSARCPFCGEDLGLADERPWEHPYRRPVRRDAEPHRGTLILVFGILSLVLGALGLPFGIAAWVMGGQDLKKMAQRSMDPEGRGLTQAGKICGIVGTLLQSVSLVLLVAYFIVFFAILLPAAMRTKPVPVPPPPAVPAPVPAPPAPPAPAPVAP